MGFFKPDKPAPIQSPGAPPPPPPVVGQQPVGKKPKPKSTMPSFLGQEASPDSTQTSNKTLLGQ